MARGGAVFQHVGVVEHALAADAALCRQPVDGRAHQLAGVAVVRPRSTARCGCRWTAAPLRAGRAAGCARENRAAPAPAAPARTRSGRADPAARSCGSGRGRRRSLPDYKIEPSFRHPAPASRADLSNINPPASATMGPVDAFWHLLGLFLPALGTGLIAAAAAKGLFWRAELRRVTLAAAGRLGLRGGLAGAAGRAGAVRPRRPHGQLRRDGGGLGAGAVVGRPTR